MVEIYKLKNRMRKLFTFSISSKILIFLRVVLCILSISYWILDNLRACSIDSEKGIWLSLLNLSVGASVFLITFPKKIKYIILPFLFCNLITYCMYTVNLILSILTKDAYFDGFIFSLVKDIAWIFINLFSLYLIFSSIETFDKKTNKEGIAELFLFLEGVNKKGILKKYVFILFVIIQIIAGIAVNIVHIIHGMTVFIYDRLELIYLFSNGFMILLCLAIVWIYNNEIVVKTAQIIATYLTILILVTIIFHSTISSIIFVRGG